jgi:hypothetical protein
VFRQHKPAARVPLTTNTVTVAPVTLAHSHSVPLAQKSQMRSEGMASSRLLMLADVGRFSISGISRRCEAPAIRALRAAITRGRPNPVFDPDKSCHSVHNHR